MSYQNGAGTGKYETVKPNALDPHDPGMAGLGFDRITYNSMEIGSRDLLRALHREHPTIMAAHRAAGRLVIQR